MATFLTGATGYLGSYLAAGLLREGEELRLLVRARDVPHAEQRLWKSLQLHLDFSTFRRFLEDQVRLVPGELTESRLGLTDESYAQLVRDTSSVIHCAASLNRRSERSCASVNLRGTLAVVRVARSAHDDHGLRRFSQISTVAVAGHRLHETVSEDDAIDWNRRDYDPYGRTKKFAEHLVRELLPEVPRTVFRPSIVLGDSMRPETTQFDMVRAFSFLAGLPALPFRPLDRLDIVPANWAAEVIVKLHRQESPAHEIYHVSSGAHSETYQRITGHLALARGKRDPLYLPVLERPSGALAGALARFPRTPWSRGAALLHVFFPYLVYDTVFDNTRAVRELGTEPAPFTSYCLPLLEFARRNGFRYPYAEWPAHGPSAAPEPVSTERGGLVTDLLLELWTAGLIEWSHLAHRRSRAPGWRPGEPLDLLFAGYNGARNTGSDVRVEEMLRQVRQILGPDRVRLSVLTQNRQRTSGYFGDAEQVVLPNIFPPFLYREVPRHDGVVTCEGSMFKSRFADALTTMMIGALGIAAARNKLSVEYGAEAGSMSHPLRLLTRRYCNRSLVITRNEESQKILRGLKVRTEPGTDTAWTFEPHGPESGRRALTAAGWDGQTPVLAVCPINPFWWPVKASLGRAAARTLTGAYRESHYRSVYFHASGEQVAASFERYLAAIAGAVKEFRRRHSVFLVLVAMERLDTDACHRLAARLDGAPVFTSDDHDMFELVSLLRECHLMVSSRYHAIVTSMPALVPSAGITMDERIRNLMLERGHGDLLLEVDDPELEARLLEVLEKLVREQEAIRDSLGASVVRNLKRMARMGLFFEEEVARCFPGFETRSGLVPWEDYLPPLSPGLRTLLEAHEGDEPAAPLSDPQEVRAP